MPDEIIRDRQGSHLESKERAAYIQRIALLNAALELYEKKWKQLGYETITPPKVDAVRPAILAEGVVAELKRLQAELRVADEDLAAAERRAEQLATELERLRVSAAGVGTTGSSAVLPETAEVLQELAAENDSELDDARYLPADEDPAVIHQQRIPDVATTPTTAIEAKAAEPDPLDQVVLRFLKKRGSAASAAFIASQVTAAGRSVTAADVVAALELLVFDGSAREQDLGGTRVWRA